MRTNDDERRLAEPTDAAIARPPAAAMAGAVAVGDVLVPRAAPPAEAAAPPLPFGLQLARDARTRVVAACCVVLVHAAYPPGHAALAASSDVARAAWAVLFALFVSFPVNAFVLLSFLGLAPRVDAGLSAGRLVLGAARRLAPAHVFWALAFLGAKALARHEVPSPGAVLEGVLLGKAAAHLYFTPQLLMLTAAAPLLHLLARTAAGATAGGVAIALCGVGLQLAVGGEGGVWAGALVGFLGLAPYALAGLALARAWGGMAPPAAQAPAVRRAAWVLAGGSAAALVAAVLVEGPGPLPLTPLGWLGNAGCALGVPILLLSLPGAVPFRILRLAPYTLGVYLVHPFFVMALRAMEGRVAALAGWEPLLAVPNAAATIALGFATIVLLSRTPLRRTVL